MSKKENFSLVGSRWWGAIFLGTVALAAAPHLSAEITLVSRLSDAQAYAQTNLGTDSPPAQTQTDFLTASLSNSAMALASKGGPGAWATSLSNSSISVDNSAGTMRVTGDGHDTAWVLVPNGSANSSAKVISLTFTLTDNSSIYSLSGQLVAGYNGPGSATAKLAMGSSTIFNATTSAPPYITLSQTGTLSPGTYTFSVDISAAGSQTGAPPPQSSSSCYFTFALDPAPTPTPGPGANISGSVSYCSSPSHGPVPNVMISLTGSGSGTALSDGSGNYIFSSMPLGGNYLVTPSKNALSPGAAGINTVDVVATQLQYLGVSQLPPGCQTAAADVNGDSAITTVDVIAIQRFYLGLSTSTANAGKYQFSPASRSYSNLAVDQTNQNYDALIFGDVVSPFVSP